MTSSSFTPGTYVWIKQEGYCWWPGFIVDPATVDLPPPNPPQQVCVQCFPMATPTCVYATCADTELRLFNGAGKDDQMIQEGLAEAECAVAVKEILQATSQHEPTVPAEVAAARSDARGEDSAEVNENILLGLDMGADIEAAEEAAERRRQRKLDKKMKRMAREETEAAASRRQKTEYGQRCGTASNATRQSRLDEYERQAAQSPRYDAEADAAYFFRQFKTTRQSVPDETVVVSVEKLQAAIATSMQRGYNEAEEEILSCLRTVARYQVSYEQLASTRIGTVVGQLLKKSYTPRVRELANGVLTYWFKSLPQNVQHRFSENRELDRCSVETVGDRSDAVDARLGVVGIHLFESFTEEELYDAPPHFNLAEVCCRIEAALQEAHADDRDTRVMVLTAFGDPQNAPLRRAVLEGRITEQEIAANATDLASLAARSNPRSGREIITDFSAVGSPTMQSPNSAGSGSFSSPTGRGSMGNITSAYTCPNCGDRDAYRTVYSVQAHDNYPDILCCRKCDTTWNITNQ